MSRPLRIQFPGAVYHVTSRGDNRQDIFFCDSDRYAWIALFGKICKRFDWACYAWCQMNNHYHAVIETRQANLSRGMRELNGVYTQAINRTHERVGHVFQGRFKAILVDREEHLLEVCRYVVLNPVRAQVSQNAEAWRWSSYRATIDKATCPDWLKTDALLQQFGRNHDAAVLGYVRFVSDGALSARSPWTTIKNQLVLGDERFAKAVLSHADRKSRESKEIPLAQRDTLPEARHQSTEQRAQDEAIARFYRAGGMTMTKIAQHLGVHYSTVSRSIHRYEQRRRETNED